jgi:hypothetical protein
MRRAARSSSESTLYKPVIVPYAARVIRVLTARGMRPVNRQDALNPAAVRAPETDR